MSGPATGAGTPSLRRRLLALVLATVTLGWVVTCLVGYFNARHEAHELFDAHLAQTAALLVAQASAENEEVDLEHAPSLHRHGRKTAFQIWEHGRELRLHSSNAPNTRLSGSDEGFSDVVHGDVAWRVFSAWGPGREFLVQVAERQDARDEIAAALARSLTLSLLAVLPLLGIALWLAVTQGLRPLDRLRADLAGREPGRLSPLPADGVPAEVRPLVSELNQLFGRIEGVMERQRRFTADAAHELRTPLAGLRTQAQVARSARDGAVRDEALDGIITGTARATRLVEQLLTLARLESGDQRADLQRIDLREVVRAALAELAPRAMDSGITLEFDEGGAVPFDAYPGLAEVLVRNLLDNAVRYTAAGGRVHAALVNSDGGPCLAIENSDTGDAMSPAALARLGERFYRVEGSSESGSGLGLSIARRIAQLHHGEIGLAPSAQGAGLRVTVRLPAAR